MKRIIYRVGPARGDMRGKWEKRRLGADNGIYYKRQADAIKAARLTCLWYVDQGGRAMIRLCGRDGRVRREWTYPRSSDPRESRG